TKLPPILIDQFIDVMRGREVIALQRKKINFWPYLLISPALLIVVFVIFIPVIEAIIMSFQSYDLRRPDKIDFIGLINFFEIFKDLIFWLSLKNTFYCVFFGVGL